MNPSGSRSRGAAQTINTLLVDDQPFVLDALAEAFENRAFSVKKADSLGAALQALNSYRFELVVTDMRMETPTSGFDVVKAAKARPEAPVVVILTAFPLPSSEWRRAGADTLTMKGKNIDLLLDELEQLVLRRRQKNTTRSSHHAGR